MGWDELDYWIKGMVIGLGLSFTPVGWILGLIIYKIIPNLPDDEGAIVFIFGFGSIICIIFGGIFGQFFKRKLEEKKRAKTNPKEGTFNLLSIVSLLSTFVPLFSIISLILSTISISQIRRNKQKGLGIAILAFIISFIEIIYLTFLIFQ